MFEVVQNDLLAPNLHRMVVKAPRVAAARKAGQFVIVRADREAERIPLTIGDADVSEGTITLFVQAIGASTRNIVEAAAGGVSAGRGGPARPADRDRKLGPGRLRRRRGRHRRALPPGQGPGRARQRGDHHHRRAFGAVHHPRRRAGEFLQRRSNHHRRRQSRPQGVRHRRAGRPDGRPGSVARRRSLPSGRCR